MKKRIIAGLLAVVMCMMPALQSVNVFAIGQSGSATQDYGGFTHMTDLEAKSDDEGTVSGNISAPEEADLSESEPPAGKGETEERNAEESSGANEEPDEIEGHTLSGANLDGVSTLSGNGLEEMVTLSADYGSVKVTVTSSGEAIPAGCSRQASMIMK